MREYGQTSLMLARRNRNTKPLDEEGLGELCSQIMKEEWRAQSCCFSRQDVFDLTTTTGSAFWGRHPLRLLAWNTVTDPLCEIVVPPNYPTSQHANEMTTTTNNNKIRESNYNVKTLLVIPATDSALDDCSVPVGLSSSFSDAYAVRSGQTDKEHRK